MENRLREALRHLWTWLWRPRGPIAVKTAHEDKGGRRLDARTRFWTEFREGRRQAEENRSRLDH